MIQVVPLNPTLGVVRVESGSTTTSIEVEMPSITGTNNGGSDITSYSLEWNGGAGSTFTTLVGIASDNLNRFYTQAGLTTSTTYIFRYKVKNIFGWSGYSP